MTYELRFDPDALKLYQNAEKPLARKLARCFEQLQRDPTSSNMSKRLTGESSHLWRYRIGGYRVIYNINEAAKVVRILRIEPRDKAYD